MADFTKTITNGINVFGGEPATKWGQGEYPYTMVWGTTKWGEGSYTIVLKIGKAISESITPSDLYQKGPRHVVSESIALSSDPTIERLSDGGIWNYVFVSDTTNAEERDPVSYTCGAAATTSYTCLAAGSTTWS